MTTLGQRHRQEQLALRARTMLTLHQLWPALDMNRLPDTYPAWARATGSVVQSARDESTDIAAAYMLDVWDEASLKQGDVVRPDSIAPERLAISAFVTSVIAFRIALRAGNDPGVADQQAMVASSGAMTRLTLEAGRETVVETARKDPRLGWQRIADGSPCDFCQMLADRGAVYTEESSSFEAHDHCGCNAEAVPRDDATT